MRPTSGRMGRRAEGNPGGGGRSTAIKNTSTARWVAWDGRKWMGREEMEERSSNAQPSEFVD